MKRIFKFRQQKIGERNIDYQRAFDAALKAAQNAHDNKWVFYEDAAGNCIPPTKDNLHERRAIREAQHA